MDVNTIKTSNEHSAGGVVIYNNSVLVIKTKNLKAETVFTFPKGHIEKGESRKQAAIREVEEETGLKAEIVEKLDDVNYWFIFNNTKIYKTVSWFIMKPVSEKEVDKLSPDKTEEKIQSVEWVSLDKVEKILSYDSDKRLIQLLKEKIKV